MLNVLYCTIPYSAPLLKAILLLSNFSNELEDFGVLKTRKGALEPTPSAPNPTENCIIIHLSHPTVMIKRPWAQKTPEFLTNVRTIHELTSKSNQSECSLRALKGHQNLNFLPLTP